MKRTQKCREKSTRRMHNEEIEVSREEVGG
jgi:hypothetical protein